MIIAHKWSVRTLAALAFSAANLLVPGGTAGAQTTTTVTFNTLTESSPGSGTRYVGNCYAESGFLFTAVGLPCTGETSLNAFLAGSANSPVFGGGSSPSLILNSPLATMISVARMDGAFFTFSSISLAPFDGAATTIVFTGIRAGGNVTRTVTLAGSLAGFQTFSFADLFTGVSAVQIAATNQYGEKLVKFDDFTAVSVAGVVPEPATVVLFAAGLFGVLVLSSRKRNRA